MDDKKYDPERVRALLHALRQPEPGHEKAQEVFSRAQDIIRYAKLKMQIAEMGQLIMDLLTYIENPPMQGFNNLTIDTLKERARRLLEPAEGEE